VINTEEGKIITNDLTPYLFNPEPILMQFDFFASEFHLSSQGVQHETIILVLNTNKAEKPEALEFNITHYLCRTYLGPLMKYLRNSNDLLANFAVLYVINITDEIRISADVGSTK
jgi:hypothetical protein